MESPGKLLEGVRGVIREVKELVSEALDALRSYDLDRAQLSVSLAAERLDQAFKMVEELEEYVKVRSRAGA